MVTRIRRISLVVLLNGLVTNLDYIDATLEGLTKGLEIQEKLSEEEVKFIVDARRKIAGINLRLEALTQKLDH